MEMNSPMNGNDNWALKLKWVIETQDIMILTMTNDQSWDWILAYRDLKHCSEIQRRHQSKYQAEPILCRYEFVPTLWITWKFTWEYTNLWNQFHRKEFYQHSDSEKFSFLYIQERRQAVWLKSNLPLAPSHLMVAAIK